MSEVSVNLLSPDGSMYRVRLDAQAQYDELLSALVERLGLPVRKSPKDDYVLNLIGALKLEDDATIAIGELNPPDSYIANKRIRLWREQKAPLEFTVNKRINIIE
jgi:hypothetical protein